MEDLQETLFSAIRYQIKFDQPVIKHFFEISDVLYGGNSDFKKNMTDFIENKNNSQSIILPQVNHKLTKDVQRLGRAQLDAYIAREKCEVVKNYFINLKRTIETDRYMHDLKNSEYILIQTLGERCIDDVDHSTLRNTVSTMLLFYNYVTYKDEMQCIAFASDLVGI